MIHMRAFTKFEEDNLNFLTQKSLEYTIVQITKTGYSKSILDATDPMRQYFKEQGMHDYATQAQGPENKVSQYSAILDASSCYYTTTSLYRPITKKGAPRIWTYDLKKHCDPDDLLLFIYHNETLYLVNISKVNIKEVYLSDLETPLKELIRKINGEVMCVANELIGLLQNMALDWHPAEVLADTGIGRAIESILGIEMNSSQQPDYKGIELKSYREKRPGVRGTLFSQVPDWKNSHFKSARELVEKYGYYREGKERKTYHNTLSCKAPNSQNLALSLYQIEEILAIEEKAPIHGRNGQIESFKKVADVALWQLPLLHKRLREKHHETFWIEVETRKYKGEELFRPTRVEHTKNPILSQFDTLLSAGYITVDLLLCRQGRGGDTVSFKISKKHIPLLFPGSTQIEL